jgi:hypothetical protein
VCFRCGECDWISSVQAMRIVEQSGDSSSEELLRVREIIVIVGEAWPAQRSAQMPRWIPLWMRRDLLTAPPRFDNQSSKSAWLSSFASAAKRLFRVLPLLSVAVNSQRSKATGSTQASSSPKTTRRLGNGDRGAKFHSMRWWRARLRLKTGEQPSEATMLIQTAV